MPFLRMQAKKDYLARLAERPMPATTARRFRWFCTHEPATLTSGLL
jgi:hypothetical protein